MTQSMGPPCAAMWLNDRPFYKKKKKKKGHVLDSLILCKNRKQLSEREAAARGEHWVFYSLIEALCKNVFCAYLIVLITFSLAMFELFVT